MPMDSKLWEGGGERICQICLISQYPGNYVVLKGLALSSRVIVFGK